MLLKLSDVMRNAGLNPKEVKLARHPMSDKDAKFCYENGFFELYLKTQGKKRFENCRYILNFEKAEGSLTVTPTGGAGTKVGLSDPVV